MNHPAISAEELSKSFRRYHDYAPSLKGRALRGRRNRFEEFWALKDVSLEVGHGETIGLIGRNGSGKSTLLKCLVGILVPEQGQSNINGRYSALLELGAGFHPDLSGRENVYLNGALLGLSRIELSRQFDNIVEFAGLEQFIDTPVRSYSSGMHMRLGFSIAIHMEPEVLLVDEALAVGDEIFQRACLDRFHQLRREGRTILLVSHDLSTIGSLCDRIVWLDHGEIHMDGPSDKVIDAYREGVVASEPHRRLGSGEIRLGMCSLQNPDSSSPNLCRTGDDVTIKFPFSATETIVNPQLCLTIRTTSGDLVSGPTTVDVGLAPGPIAGEGSFVLTLPRIALLPGTYQVDASIRDNSSLVIFDLAEPALKFTVLPGEGREPSGLVTLWPHWAIETDPT